MSPHYLKLFEKVVFGFIWSCKSEPLNRETMYLPVKLGGQNVVNISLKLDCLHLKHIRDLINGCTAKWTYLAIYWIGLYLRNYNPQFSSLSIPHSDFIPPFYKHCLDLLKTFNDLTNNKELKNLTVKDMYMLSSSSHPPHPRIESIHPHLDFVNIWKPFQNKFVNPFSRDVSWRIVHEILPVQHLLCKYKISKIHNCNLCNSSLETISHLFYSCPLIQPMLDLLFDYISFVADERILPSEISVLYHVLPPNLKLPAHAKDVILYLLMDFKFIVWTCRNLKKFENRNINSNYIVMSMNNRLKFRIECDFKRLPFSVFHDCWISPYVFCDLDEEDDSKLDFNF